MEKGGCAEVVLRYDEHPDKEPTYKSFPLWKIAERECDVPNFGGPVAATFVGLAEPIQA